MEGLLCDEVWLSSPETHELESCRSLERSGAGRSSKEECDEAYVMFLEKEMSYMPEPGYVENLQFNNSLTQSRSRAIQWLLKSRSRLNLSFGTVFNAANYLDRFICMNQCHVWRYWMIELLSVACLSIASKFTDTSAPSLHEIQMEDLDYSFQSNTIKRMELTVLQALGWRLGCITAYSYAELLISNLDSLDTQVLNELTSRVNKLLLGSLLDFKLLEYRSSAVAVSAVWCTLDELNIPSSHAHLAYITRPFDQDQKDDVVKCHTMMKSRRGAGKPGYWPSSPVTVLMRERVDIYDRQVDLSIFKKIPTDFNPESCKRRKKQEG